MGGGLFGREEIAILRTERESRSPHGWGMLMGNGGSSS